MNTVYAVTLHAEEKSRGRVVLVSGKTWAEASAKVEPSKWERIVDARLVCATSEDVYVDIEI
jgi:hypothetical protein